MTIRAQTLEEWFTDYQLRALAKRHYHLPFDLEVDVTHLVRAYEAAGERAPFSAIVIKAAAVLAIRRPEVNRAVLRTPLGTRVVQFDAAHVNVPVAIEHAGKRHLTATVIRDADRLSVGDIARHLQVAKAKPIAELPIARRFVENRNTFSQRLRLKARHFLAHSVPPLYERHGGGISVSSLVRPAPAGVSAHIPSYGPTAFTICPGARREQGGRSLLHVGIGYDHSALPGVDAVGAAEYFASLLVEGDPALFGPLTAPKGLDATAPS